MWSIAAAGIRGAALDCCAEVRLEAASGTQADGWWCGFAVHGAPRTVPEAGPRFCVLLQSFEALLFRSSVRSVAYSSGGKR